MQLISSECEADLLKIFCSQSFNLAKIVPDDVDVTKDELLERIMQLEFKMCVKDVEELEKVKLARLKRLQEFKRIERIYYPY